MLNAFCTYISQINFAFGICSCCCHLQLFFNDLLNLPLCLSTNTWAAFAAPAANAAPEVWQAKCLPNSGYQLRFLKVFRFFFFFPLHRWQMQSKVLWNLLCITKASMLSFFFFIFFFTSINFSSFQEIFQRQMSFVFI